MANQWVDWSALLASVPEEERQTLEQSFTQLAEPAPDSEDTPYQSQAAEGVEAALKTLEREGRVKEEDGKILIERKLIPDAFQKYI